MKTIIKILLILLVGVSAINAQTTVIKYTYDNTGNRVNRQVIEINNRNKNATPVKNYFGETSITLYPNPVKETLNIDIVDYIGKSGTISLYSIDGRLLKQKKIKDKKMKLNFRKLSTGTYVVKIELNGNVEKYTIIK